MQTQRIDSNGYASLQRAPISDDEYNDALRMAGAKTWVEPDGTKMVELSNEQYDGVLHNRAARRRKLKEERKAAKRVEKRQTGGIARP